MKKTIAERFAATRKACQVGDRVETPTGNIGTVQSVSTESGQPVAKVFTSEDEPPMEVPVAELKQVGKATPEQLPFELKQRKPFQSLKLGTTEKKAQAALRPFDRWEQAIKAKYPTAEILEHHYEDAPGAYMVAEVDGEDVGALDLQSWEGRVGPGEGPNEAPSVSFKRVYRQAQNEFFDDITIRAPRLRTPDGSAQQYEAALKDLAHEVVSIADRCDKTEQEVLRDLDNRMHPKGTI